MTDHIHLGVGVFRNSPCNISVLGLVGAETDTRSMFGIGVAAGIASGYTRDSLPTAPFVGFPYLRVGANTSPVVLKIMIIPHPEGVGGLSFGTKF